MNISSVGQISAFQQAGLQQKISTAVLGKVHDVAKAQGEQLIQLISEASEATEPAGGDGDADDGHSLSVTA